MSFWNIWLQGGMINWNRLFPPLRHRRNANYQYNHQTEQEVPPPAEVSEEQVNKHMNNIILIKEILTHPNYVFCHCDSYWFGVHVQLIVLLSWHDWSYHWAGLGKHLRWIMLGNRVALGPPKLVCCLRCGGGYYIILLEVLCCHYGQPVYLVWGGGGMFSFNLNSTM